MVKRMRSTPRPRRYLGPIAFGVSRPMFRYDYWRDAYVLRVVGDRSGPVIRRDRRSGGSEPADFTGPNRRALT
jgi:hypothetical protein